MVFSFKNRTQGGIVDIEFMAQYAVLAWSGTKPDLAHYSDNVRILEDAAKADCLSSEDATALIRAYLSERAESHRLALANQSMQVSAATGVVPVRSFAIYGKINRPNRLG